MYAVTPDAAAAWRDLLTWVARASGVALEVIDHPPAQPIAELWGRGGLGSVFMCGRPWLRAAPQPIPIACPLPSPDRYGGRPVYMTDFVVRAESGFTRLEDTFGHRIGYTLEESHSGFNAPRHHLLAFRRAGRPALYGESVGPLHTPRGVVAALLDGRIDVGPLDSYAFDLMRAQAGDPAHRLRRVATTDPAPIPLLVASPDCPADTVAALRRGVLAASTAADLASVRARLLLKGFVPVDEPAYAQLAAWDDEALSAGYDQPR
ncbi:phosphate/phosphite/phosphonate ABC transporter substrate-binding protein [Methylobacterium terricola]|uniref:Phosphate/phosphite/phosphonate ABC transporter substrate-binding protein n=2 Tax=Methylobacterium terricola TaxID=2583531 RepID=A0A5C4L8A0_9HYPH|nr:phosphate/phosphite/phosphonate ABC transporter substrate-binding protein [Methylobacterium terricola]